jgi:ketosteroid isomerase-like protein
MSIRRSLAASLMTLLLTAGPLAAKDSQEATNLSDVLTRHDAAFNAHDLDGVMASYASNPQVALMGTGPGEFWQGRQAISETYQRFFDDFDVGTFTSQCPWKDSGVDDASAWLLASCVMTDAKADKTREYVLNISAYFTKEGDAWKIQSLHYSHLTGGPS